jgi:glucosamine--fructose-6-phosphate aminotransferase (isomerizing)
LHRKLPASTIILAAGREVSVAATKTWFAQSATLFLMILNSVTRRQQVTDTILKLCPRFNTYLRQSAFQDAQNVTSLLFPFVKDRNYICILGVGTAMSCVAKEGALKMKEVSYTFVDSYASASLKHGPLSLVDDSIPIIVLYDGDSETKEDFNTCCNEIASRGAFVAVILPDTMRDMLCKQLNLHTICYPAMTEDKTNILHSLIVGVILQYVALELAKRKHLNPDKPRNLAKSVTVR